MSLKRRALEGIVVAGSLMMMCVIVEAGQQGNETIDAASAGEVKSVEIAAVVLLNEDHTAGLGRYMAQLEEEIPAVEVEQTRTQLVASAQADVSVDEAITADHTMEDAGLGELAIEDAANAEDAMEADTVNEEQQQWQNCLMADVDEFLYVRASADANAEIVGKLYKGAVAEIVDESEEWTHITSGNVEGYVSNEYCVSGTEAMEYANANFDVTAQIETNGLRVRSEADTDSAILTSVSEGATLAVDTSVETTDEWVAVQYKGNTGYVSAEYVTTGLALGEAVSIEEERAAAKAKEEAEAAKAAEAKAAAATATVQNSAVAASYDELTLLAALIQCEAGNECYEGQVAVGAVVMNRVRSGAYPGSIYGVIYDPYQFSPAGSGQVAAVAANGPKASCIQAAQEALNGVDNTGGKLSFRRASSGRAGVVIGNHVFF